MKLFVYNAPGLGFERAFQVLHLLKRDICSEVKFLMETKTENVRMEQLRIILGFASELVMHSNGRSGGLCLFWSSSVVVDLLSFSRFHIDVKILLHNPSACCA